MTFSLIFYIKHPPTGAGQLQDPRDNKTPSSPLSSEVVLEGENSKFIGITRKRRRILYVGRRSLYHYLGYVNEVGRVFRS